MNFARRSTLAIWFVRADISLQSWVRLSLIDRRENVFVFKSLLVTKRFWGMLMARPRIHASDADRVKAHREKHGVVALTFDIPQDVLAQFEEYLKFKDVKKSDVLVKLIKSQLLRKR